MPKLLCFALIWTFIAIPTAYSSDGQATRLSEPSAASDGYFFLSSDAVRALRDVGPAPVLTLRWTRHVDIIDGPGKPEDKTGTLSLGRDYYVVQDSEATEIVDFALQRVLHFNPGKQSLRNDSIFWFIDLCDMEAINRAFIKAFVEKASLPVHLPGHEQYLYEAELGVRTHTLAPIAVRKSVTDDNVAIRFKDEEIAAFHFGDTSLTNDQSHMLARALRHIELIQIHPAALETVLPLQRLPTEISAIHAFHVASKARTTLKLEAIKTIIAPYPLPGGLDPDLHDKSGLEHESAATFLDDVIDTALSAIRRTYHKPQPTFEDYAVDAERAYAGGDLFEAGLTWLAATVHYPDRIAACDTREAPAFCTAFHEQLKAAGRDPQFARVVEGSLHCTRHEAVAGAKALARVDISGMPHGYVVSMLLACTLSDLSPQKAKAIEGLGSRHPATAMENEQKAIEANPYIPSYYYDVGANFAVNYENWVAWRLFDLGLALGGGRKGDAFDTMLKQRKQELLSRYPGYF